MNAMPPVPLPPMQTVPMVCHSGAVWDGDADHKLLKTEEITVSWFTSHTDSIGHMQTFDWQAFADKLMVRREGAKNGANFVPATFALEPDGRVRRLKANVIARTAIVLDCEMNKETGVVPPSLDTVVHRLKSRHWAGVVYTSHNHTRAAPRYRVVVPLSEPIQSELPAPGALAEMLDLRDVIDESKIGAASLFYLPSCEPGDMALHQAEQVPGDAIAAADMQAWAGKLLADRANEQARIRADAMADAAKRREAKIKAGFDTSCSIIEAVRQRLDLDAELVAHGYERKGNGRYLFPGSETGVPGVYVMSGRDGVDRVYSHHAGDPLAAANLPTWCSTKAVDVVDVVTILDYCGDVRVALRALAQQFGISSARSQHSELPPGNDEPPQGWDDEPPYPGDDAGAGADAAQPRPTRRRDIVGIEWPQPLDFLADQDSEPPDLQAEHIPEALFPFVIDMAERMGVDPATVALGCIVSCAAVVTDDWRLQPKRHDYTWTESPRLWGAIVGDPSILKTPVIAACTKPIDKLDAQARMRHAEAMRVYKRRLAEWKKDKTGAVPEPVHPKLDRFMVEGATVEALSEVLRDDDDATQRAPSGKVLSRQDEMSEFFGNLDRYKAGGKGGGDRGAYLRLFNGGPYTIDRIGRGAFSVPNWSACFLGGIQPGPIQKIAKDATEDGLLQRFVYIVPGAQKLGADRAPDDAAHRCYSSLFPALIALHPPRAADGTHVQSVTFHADAHQHREEVDLTARAMAVLPDTSVRLKSAFGKWPGIFARVALVFHLVDIAAANASGVPHKNAMVITEATAKRAAAFMLDIVLPHLLRADAVMFLTEQTGHARWIAGFILARGGTRIASRDIVQNYGALRSPEAKAELAAVMASLVTVGWLEPELPTNPMKPIAVWFVNPSVHKMFAVKAQQERARREEARVAIAVHVEMLRRRRGVGAETAL